MARLPGGRASVQRNQVVIPPRPTFNRRKGDEAGLDRQWDAGGTQDLADEEVLDPRGLRQFLATMAAAFRLRK